MHGMQSKIFSTFWLVVALQLVAFSAQGVEQSSCFEATEVMAPLTCPHTGVSFSIPRDWNVSVQEYKTVVTVEDLNGGCRIQYSLLESPLSPRETARLYEGLYFGENRLSGECKKKLQETFGGDEEWVLGEYSQRLRDNQILALFTQVEGRNVVGFLRCPKNEQNSRRWGLALQSFSTFHVVDNEPQVASLLHGNWLDELVDYFREKIDFSLPQAPVF